VGLKEVKTEIRDLSNNMDRKFDRMLYVAITGLAGLLAKWGVDYYYYMEKKQQKGTTEQEA
jgi:hypothetical protein